MSIEILTDILGNGVISVLVAGMAGVIMSALSYYLKKTAEYSKYENEKIKELQKAIHIRMSEVKEKSVDEVSTEIKRITSDKEIEEKISKAVQNSINAITKNTQESLSFVSELVNGYHQQALSQARVQFWFSVVAATAGFVYILVAANKSDSSNYAVIINVIPGVVIDAVAFLFFKQAEQTRERATALYDRLRQDSQMESAKEIVESIEDVRIKSLVKAQIALYLSGLKPKEIDLQVPLDTTKA